MAIEVRLFRPDDAPRLAEIVQRCLREVNSHDYPADIIDKMCAYYTAERFVELSSSRLVYVAEDVKVVGTVSRDGNKVYTMFVDPDLARRGTGRQLMRHIEALAARDGHDHMETGASITAHRFYLELGYTDVHESETEFGLNLILHKPLPSAAPDQ
ncbi:GNAT family N-acetyltransferase [Streptomyces sp. SID3343]|uniref:GNAT family N-acetyltransferase n=1 Tax=Streptomyces sp. SID3343 TaxID=2690260 RepID=UPI00137161D1|nr:GNAT family N-acetyltransferase [Streptomyces sp. SID3343]MYW04763.1 GNAT family N-acetyltransferase [Streptomyces sp. SID3343]